MREPPEPPMTAYKEEDEEEEDDGEEGEECVVGLRMMEADVEDSGLGGEMENKSANAGKQGTRWNGMGWMRFGWDLEKLTFCQVQGSSTDWATDRMHQELRGQQNHLLIE